MANDFVAVDLNSRFGRNLVELSNVLRRAKELATATKERMAHMNDGTDFTPVATHHGIPQADSAKGQDAVTLINGLVTALNGPAVTALIERVG